MSDILKHIRHPAGELNDPNGNLMDLAPWSEQAAGQRAAELGLELSEDHWDVVLFVRDYYRGRGAEASAREILGALEDEFVNDGGRRWLYRLFPGGPVRQAAHIAGIPRPQGVDDPAFGVAH